MFGQPFDQERYDQVIEDSALAQDLAMLPFGDQTEIGEKVSPPFSPHFILSLTRSRRESPSREVRKPE